MKLGNPKNAFWEALLLAGVLFVFGLVLGISFEAGKLDEINKYYAESEIFLMDIFALNNIANFENISCEQLINSNVEFADKIYDEARLLEKYEESGKISESMKIAHKKYDLLRTFLWMNTMKIKSKCDGDFSYIVYLYEYDPDDLVKKATQRVWSEVLFQLKQEKGNEIVLIPIAVNSDLTSLDVLIKKFNISDSPAVIINDKKVIYELNSVSQLKDYLD
jgi:hypothetical protein